MVAAAAGKVALRVAGVIAMGIISIAASYAGAKAGFAVAGSIANKLEERKARKAWKSI